MIELTVCPRSGGLHATGLFMHDKYYYYYDPNGSNGEYRDTSIEDIARFIFNKYSDSLKIIEAGIVIYDFVDDKR